MKLVAYILNYDKDANARYIVIALPCESYVIDSSGKHKAGFIPTDHPYFAGCLNKAMQLFLESDATHCLLICSDVIGNWKPVIERMMRIPNSVGAYSPASYGQGWRHNKPKYIGLREVPFVEGIMACYRRDIVEGLYPIYFVNNKHSFGVDIYAAYLCHMKGYLSVVDDSIAVYHPYGTGYNGKEGARQMKGYIKSKGKEFEQWVKDEKIFEPTLKRWLRKISEFDLGKIFGYYR